MARGRLVRGETLDPLPRTFAARDPVLVAKALLGAVLVHEIAGVVVISTLLSAVTPPALLAILLAH